MKKTILSIIEKLKIIRGNVNRNDRFSALYRAWGHVFSNNMYGDYVEFGVYRGDSVIFSLQAHYEFMKWLNNQKKSDEGWRKKVSNKSPLNKLPQFHCLDTFGGMPNNKEGEIQFHSQSFTTSLELVKKKVSKRNHLGIQINFYKGLFKNNESNLKDKLKKRKIVIANIDCDLKESTTEALNSISDFIDVGTILLFDDYNAFKADNKRGQRLAFIEFRSKSKFKFEKHFSYHMCGQSFLVVDKK